MFFYLGTGYFALFSKLKHWCMLIQKQVPAAFNETMKCCWNAASCHFGNQWQKTYSAALVMFCHSVLNFTL